MVAELNQIPVPAPEAELPIRTVSEVTRQIREAVGRSPGLRDVWVEGEVGQVNISAAGHCYFTLKDEKAQLRCVIFRDDRLMMPFEARTGLRLVAHGRLDVFEPQGVYQLYVESIQPSGLGDLALRFEALKAKLSAEGLFASERKRPLPAYPAVIGLATSLSGAVLHDMRKVLGRRWPMVRVIVAACQVQGQGSAPTIVAALRRLARWTDAETGRGVDLVILARGGGSLEDLWSFNEEIVVRAVAASPCPIVVGVGHETDVTLAEFAADVRAATPSVAAELAVPARSDELARLRNLRGRLDASAGRALRERRQTFDGERRALDGLHPTALLAAERERVGLLLDRATRLIDLRLDRRRTEVLRAAERLPSLTARHIGQARAALERTAASLGGLSPFATLERGYAIVRDERGRVVRNTKQVAVAEAVSIQLHRGRLDARVEGVQDSTDD